MKEIILISAYTPDTERQDNLRNLIISLKNLHYRICLITHTSTPQDIVDKCDYFLYDVENELSYDPKLKYWYSFISNNIKISFVDYVSIASHIIPVFRMYLGGLAYLKSMGEEIIHMIEYDTIVKNRKIWDDNLEILKEKDAVFYSFPRFYENNKLVCVYSFQSINVQKISYEYLQFDKSQLNFQYYQNFEQGKFPGFERLIFDNLWSKLNYHVQELSSEDDLEESFTTNLIRVGGDLETTNVNYFEDKYHFFHNNTSSTSNNFLIIINKTNSIPLEIHPYNWVWVPLDYSDVNHIQIFKNNILLKELDLNTEEGRDWIFKYSYANILTLEES
jgi:hypothetical protein